VPDNRRECEVPALRVRPHCPEIVRWHSTVMAHRVLDTGQTPRGGLFTARFTMIALKNVLVATDFSEPAAAALEYGRTVARTFGASLHVLHVIDHKFVESVLADAAPVHYAELLKTMEQDGRKRLDAVVREDDRRELNASARLLTFDGMAAGIVWYANSKDIDLIVIGTHGRTGLSHLLMGSVAEKVVRTAPCPVLTVRHPQREFIRPDAIEIVSHA
jgi:nucleotide-binding universal stress UspA family protein